MNERLERIINNNPLIWMAVAALTGGGAGVYPSLATTDELEVLEYRINVKIDAFAGSVYEILLASINDRLIDLQSIQNRTYEQEQTMLRLKTNKENLLRIIKTERRDNVQRS